MFSGKFVVITGDFNVKFCWNNKEARDVSDLLLSFGLSSTVFESTRGKNILDNVFTNIDSYLTAVVDTSLSDHNGIYFTSKIGRNLSEDKILLTRPVTQERMYYFYNVSELRDWSFVKDSTINIENTFTKFLDVIMEQCGSTYCFITIYIKITLLKGKL